MPSSKVRRRTQSSGARGVIGRWLHYFPQYTLRNLADGTVSVGEFFYLWGALLDNEQPEVTEPAEVAMTRAVRAAHIAAIGRT